MADRGSGECVIDAAVEDVWAVVVDLAAYPRWAADIKDVEVRTTGDDGLPATVDWKVGGFGVTVAYTLEYEHDPMRSQRWSLVRSNELRRMDGEYTLEALDDGTTRVNYELEVDLRIPVIGMIKRKAERKIVDHALRGLKAEVERSDRAR